MKIYNIFDPVLQATEVDWQAVKREDPFNRQRPDLWRLRGWCHAARFLHIHEYWGWFEPTRDKTGRHDSQHEIKIGHKIMFFTHIHGLFND